MNRTQKTLEEIKFFITRGGKASQWFAYAYVSWYRSHNEDRLISLAGVERLDHTNMLLFWEMINLRRGADWDEEKLYALEKLAIEVWRMNEQNHLAHTFHKK